MINRQTQSKELNDFTHAITNDETFHGLTYSNLQLYSQTMSEAVDPDCLIQPQLLSSYWPGGIPGLEGNTFATNALVDPTKNKIDVPEARRQLLGLNLSKRALRRWNDFTADLAVHHGIVRPDGGDDVMETFCSFAQVPLAAVVLSRVEKHRAIKPNEPIAHLYFPTLTLDARRPLKALQAAQLAVIAETEI